LPLNQQEIAMSSFTTSKKRFAPIAALMLASALAGCATFGETAGTCQSDGCSTDAKITSDIQSSFNAYPEFGADQLRVQTINNVVYLNGILSVSPERADAEAVARQTPGVTQVVDNIAVSK
jgi:osmotically-inducible protein OsmY